MFKILEIQKHCKVYIRRLMYLTSRSFNIMSYKHDVCKSLFVICDLMQLYSSLETKQRLALRRKDKKMNMKLCLGMTKSSLISNGFTTFKFVLGVLPRHVVRGGSILHLLRLESISLRAFGTYCIQFPTVVDIGHRGMRVRGWLLYVSFISCSSLPCNVFNVARIFL